MLRILAIVCAIILQPYAWAAEPDGFAAERRALVAEISALARETQSETGQGVFSARVMEAMGKVPRHRFVPPEVERYAYRNRPLPIGYGQTISQPFLVAYLTELLQVNKDSKVLEIGSCSGYQAAILGERIRSSCYSNNSI